MKKSIVSVMIAALLILLIQNNIFAQSGVEGTMGWRDHSGDLPKDNSGTTTLLIVGGVVVANLVVYLLISSSGDDIEKPETKEALISPVKENSILSVIQNKEKNEYGPGVPVSLYLSSQQNFMNTNSTNISVGIHYSF